MYIISAKVALKYYYQWRLVTRRGGYGYTYKNVKTTRSIHYTYTNTKLIYMKMKTPIGMNELIKLR